MMYRAKITCPDYEGEAICTYVDEELVHIEVEGAGMCLVLMPFFKYLVALPELEKLDKYFHTRKLPVKAHHEKIRLFCALYKQHTGISYRTSSADPNIIKNLELSGPLLETYFTSNSIQFHKHWSIGNLAKFYNQLRLEHTNRHKPQVRTWPDSYSAKFTKTLTGAELGQYYKHLRSRGLVAKKTVTGSIIDFVEPKLQQA